MLSNHTNFNSNRALGHVRSIRLQIKCIRARAESFLSHGVRTPFEKLTKKNIHLPLTGKNTFCSSWNFLINFLTFWRAGAKKKTKRHVQRVLATEEGAEFCVFFRGHFSECFSTIVPRMGATAPPCTPLYAHHCSTTIHSSIIFSFSGWSPKEALPMTLLGCDYSCRGGLTWSMSIYAHWSYLYWRIRDRLYKLQDLQE